MSPEYGNNMVMLLPFIFLLASLAFLLFPAPAFAQWSTDLDAPTTSVVTPIPGCRSTSATESTCPPGNVSVTLSCDDPGTGASKCAETYYKMASPPNPPNSNCEPPIRGRGTPPNCTASTNGDERFAQQPFLTNLSWPGSAGQILKITFFSKDKVGNVEPVGKSHTITFSGTPITPTPSPTPTPTQGRLTLSETHTCEANDKGRVDFNWRNSTGYNGARYVLRGTSGDITMPSNQFSTTVSDLADGDYDYTLAREGGSQPSFFSNTVYLTISCLQTGAGLPSQGYRITSTGTTDGGAARKVEVFYSFPALPAIFDFVLYSGSGLTK